MGGEYWLGITLFLFFGGMIFANINRYNERYEMVGGLTCLLGFLMFFGPLAYEFSTEGSTVYAVREEARGEIQCAEFKSGCWEWTPGKLYNIPASVQIQAVMPAPRETPYNTGTLEYQLILKMEDLPRYLGFKGGRNRLKESSSRLIANDMHRVAAFYLQRVTERHRDKMAEIATAQNTAEVQRQLEELLLPELNELLAPDGLRGAKIEILN